KLGFTALLTVALMVTLAGCSDGVGSLFADPAQYVAYHCRDMVTRWITLNAREKELKNLILKASEGTVGTAIGTVIYRPEYEHVLTEKRMLRRTAAEKKCDIEPPSNYQSDNVVR